MNRFACFGVSPEACEIMWEMDSRGNQLSCFAGVVAGTIGKCVQKGNTGREDMKLCPAIAQITETGSSPPVSPSADPSSGNPERKTAQRPFRRVFQHLHCPSELGVFPPPARPGRTVTHCDTAGVP